MWINKNINRIPSTKNPVIIRSSSGRGCASSRSKELKIKNGRSITQIRNKPNFRVKPL